MHDMWENKNKNVEFLKSLIIISFDNFIIFEGKHLQWLGRVPPY